MSYSSDYEEKKHLTSNRLVPNTKRFGNWIEANARLMGTMGTFPLS
jgi:hypothetical protein